MSKTTPVAPVTTFVVNGQTFAIVPVAAEQATAAAVPAKAKDETPDEKPTRRRRKAKAKKADAPAAPAPAAPAPAPQETQAAAPAQRQRDDDADKLFVPLHECKGNLLEGGIGKYSSRRTRIARPDFEGGLIAVVKKQGGGTYRAAVYASGKCKNGREWIHVLAVSEAKGWAYGTDQRKYGWTIYDPADKVESYEQVACTCKDCKGS